MSRYIEPTKASGARFFADPPDGPVVMLNLLRFRDVADYAAHPELAPETPISGAEAYQRYAAHALPFVEAAGGELLYSGRGGPYLIGPEDGRWDLVLLVKHQSAQAFLSHLRSSHAGWPGWHRVKPGRLRSRL